MSHFLQWPGLGQKKAFTLIELLVVLVIIGTLAALLLPVFSKAKEAANSGKCRSNLRQIGIGLIQCTSENSGILPKSAYGSTAAATDGITLNYKWMDAIFPYVSKEEIFHCPSDAGAKYRYGGNLESGTTSIDYGSYGLNGAYRDAGDGQTPPRSSASPVLSIQLEDPANTVWVADTNNREEANGSFGVSWANSATNPSITTGKPRQLEKLIARHQGNANVLFCDGHVENRTLESLAITRTVVDRITGASKTVLPLFTIEAD